MAIRRIVARGRSHPGDARYRLAFVRDVHRILALGFAALPRHQMLKLDEPAITGSLVDAMKQALSDQSAPARLSRYWVSDDPPISGRNLLGKNRPRVDIEVVYVTSGVRPQFQFEAKRLRLRDKNSVGKYLGKDGLGCFVAGRYAAAHLDAGMLGYVQSGEHGTWLDDIRTRLSSNGAAYALLSEGCHWNVRLATDLGVMLRSDHRRPTGPPIRVYHTMLDFAKGDRSS